MLFLALTAQSEYWDCSNSKILFLGEWCKLYNKQQAWNNKEYTTVPYHWDDDAKFNEDFEYIDQLSEKALLQIMQQLNRLHRVDYPSRYWRILLGFWLEWFVGVVFDRYECLRTALAYDKWLHTTVCDLKNGEITPNAYFDFAGMATTDNYNLALFSQIIEKTGIVQSVKSERMVVTKELHIQQPKHKYTFKRKVRFFIDDIVSKFVNNDIVFVDSSFGVDNIDKLLMRLGMTPVTDRAKKMENIDFKYDARLRNSISFDLGDSSFEKLLSDMLVEHIPKYYIEGYGEIKSKSLELYRHRAPKIIITAVAIYADECFKFWSAECITKNTKLLGVQHGGAYGLLKKLMVENHELRCCDTFYTWGWNENTKTKAIASPKLSRTYIKPKKDGYILHVLCSIPRYTIHLLNEPHSSSGYNIYIDEQVLFLKNLNPYIMSEIVVRLYSQDHDLKQKQRLTDRCGSDLQIDECRESMYKMLQGAKIMIGTYNATTFLETFAVNFPTIIFWNPHQWELRDDAKYYFDLLQKVKIFHTSPESAAKHLNMINDDIDKWWLSDEVQNAKNEFCNQYALTSKSWLNDWAEELKVLLR